jgi:two-component system chemotaxis sensor kinase CheA
VVIARHRGGRVGLVVDALHGESQTVTKPLGRVVGTVPGVSASAIHADGRIALVLDVDSLVDRAVETFGPTEDAGAVA